MKHTQKISTIAVISAMMIMASCNDDLDSELKNSQSVSAQSSDRLCGYTNLIVSADDLTSEHVVLSSGDLHITNENPKLSYTIEKDSDGFFLQTHVNGPATQSYYDNVTIASADGSKKEDLQVVVHKAAVASRGDTTVELRQLTDEQKKARTLLGYATDLDCELGCISGSPVIDFEKYYNDFLNNDKEVINCNSNNNGTTFYCETANSKRELSENVEKKMGIKVQFPVCCANISAGFSKEHFQKITSTKEREYLMASVNTCAFQAALDYMGMRDEIIDKRKLSDDKGYEVLLTRTVNNILNNPQSADYTFYDNTEEGMMQFLNDYGPYVITEAQFGGYAQLSYSRDKVMNNTSIKDCMAFEFGMESQVTTEGSKEASKSMESEKDNKNATAKEVWKQTIKPVAESFSLNYSNSKITTSSLENMHTSKNLVTKGGMKLATGSNGDVEWDVGTTDKLVPISYGTAKTMSNVENGRNNYSLIPIYKFCIEEKRKQILEKLLTVESNGVMRYYNLKMGTDAAALATRDNTVVLADVQLVYVDALKLTNDLVKPLQLTDPFGVERMYYPMVMSPEYPDGNLKDEVGRALTLNHGAHTGLDFTRENHGRILCYYALDYAYNTNGITTIRLLKVGDYKKNRISNNEFAATEKVIVDNKDDKSLTKIIAGVSTDCGRNGDCDKKLIDTVRLYVTYGRSDTPTADKIKGMAWRIGPTDTPLEQGYFIGATGGFEAGSTSNPTTKEMGQFSCYWSNPNNIKWDSSTHQYFTSYIEGGKFVSPKYRLFPVFIKMKSMRDMSLITTDNGSTMFPIATPRPY